MPMLWLVVYPETLRLISLSIAFRCLKSALNSFNINPIVLMDAKRFDADEDIILICWALIVAIIGWPMV